jgi:hypothetical protein
MRLQSWYWLQSPRRTATAAKALAGILARSRQR